MEFGNQVGLCFRLPSARGARLRRRRACLSPRPDVRYPSFLEDSAAAIRWVELHANEFGGDPTRLVIAGHSAGAYNGATLAYDPRWLGSDRRNVKGFIGLAGPHDFLPFDGPIAREAFKGTANLAPTQPVNFVARGDPLASWARAPRTASFGRPISIHLRRGCAPVGARVVRRTYPAAGHVGILTAIARPLRGRARVLDEVSAFARSVTTGSE